MDLQDFFEYISDLKTYRAIRQEIKAHPKILEIKYNELIERGKKEFDDFNGNIERWLDHKPCVFISPITQQFIDFDIGNNIRALYHFLEFCKMINQRKKVSDDYVEYLALLISRSNYPN